MPVTTRFNSAFVEREIDGVMALCGQLFSLSDKINKMWISMEGRRGRKMRQLLLVVLFGFLVFIYPAQELNQYDFHSADQPTISEFAYLPDVNMIPHLSSVSIEKNKSIGPFVPRISEQKRQIKPMHQVKNHTLIEIFPDAFGFITLYAYHSNYLSCSTL